MNKKLFLFLMLGIFLIGIVFAQEVSYCCEKTNTGDWCQNAPQSECDTSYRAAPTSCEATSYCKLGVCINTNEGICMPNSPQRVCEDNGGIWSAGDTDDIPQCKLGCCLIGEQAAFITQTRCKRLSSLYGLEINYRTDIQNEAECILSATANVKGACVFEEEYERNCKMTTRKECSEMGVNTETEFHEGYLCSAESLGTICGPRGGTTCVEGKDEVYFLDTCGNLANVYDSSKLNDQSYWEKITAPMCTVTDTNRKSCGNCDYFAGSTCKKGDANYGNYICKDLSCEDENFKDEYGRNPKHGETWCAYDTDKAESSLPGARNFRLVCYNGEVSVEPCAEFRQEICIQSEVNGFKTAACRVNKWQDCVSQDNKKDCTNGDKRDCKWDDENSFCVPLYSPGFNFWEEGTDAVSVCSLASTQCNVIYEGKTAYDADCIEKCWAENFLAGVVKGTSIDPCLKPECESKCVNSDGTIKDSWKKKVEGLCVALGDCGSKKNYLGQNSYSPNWDESFSRSKVEEGE